MRKHGHDTSATVRSAKKYQARAMTEVISRIILGVMLDITAEVTRNLIAERLGDPSDFSITERGGLAMEGSATVSGSTYWWSCGIGISGGRDVQVDVRSGNSSVILERVST